MRLMISLVCLVLCFGCSEEVKSDQQSNNQAYLEGMRIRQDQGPKAAMKYFRELALTKEGPKSLFHFAWSLWDDGLYKEAEEMAKVILKENDPNHLYTGHAHYLMGQIRSDQGDFEGALEQFEKAIGLYKFHEKHQSLYNAYVSLAALEIRQKRHVDAQRYLDLALPEYQAYLKKRPDKKKDLGYYYELLARIEHGQGQFRKALDYQLKSYEEYEKIGDGDKCLYARSGLGFYRILTGDLEGGKADTDAVDQAAKGKDGYANLGFYNSINWLMLYKCSGNDYHKLEKEIRDRVKLNGDTYLQEHLDFALTWNCGKE